MSASSNGFRLVLAFLAGTLLAVSSFPEINLPWLAWLVPGLILWVTFGQSAKSVLRAGFVAGMGHCLISFYWLLLIPFFWYGVAAWLALSAGLSLYIASWCGVCWYLLPNRQAPDKTKAGDCGFVGTMLALSSWQRAAWPLLCAAAWVAMEMAMGRVLSGFPFITLGAPQFRLLPLIQIASVTGVYGVSLLVAWFSVSLVGAIALLRGQVKQVPKINETIISGYVRPRPGPLPQERGKQPARQSILRVLVAGAAFLRRGPFRLVSIQLLPPVFVIGCVVLFGMKKLSEPEAASTRMKIALVQPSIPERVIWDPNEETNRFVKLLDLSREALAAKPDLLVWPEAALPEIIGRNRYTQETIGNLVRPAQVWMVMGIVDMRPKPGTGNPGKLEAFNSAFLIDPNGDLATVYDKVHLVIFGEYMPWLARQIPFLAKLRNAAELTRGESPLPFCMKKPRASFPVSICYEDCFPAEVRKRVDQDTDFILNLTNDGWFGESATQWQHAAIALFRAVENGVPLVRCTNNGLTCWVDARGRLHDIYFDASKNIYQAGWKMTEVPLRSDHSGRDLTFYNRHGDWFGWSCVGIVIIAGFATACRRWAGKK